MSFISEKGLLISHIAETHLGRLTVRVENAHLNPASEAFATAPQVAPWAEVITEDAGKTFSINHSPFPAGSEQAFNLIRLAKSYARLTLLPKSAV